jgi:hypothetical protein
LLIAMLNLHTCVVRDIGIDGAIIRPIDSFLSFEEQMMTKMDEMILASTNLRSDSKLTVNPTAPDQKTFDIFLTTLHTQLGGQKLDQNTLNSLGKIFFGDEQLLQDITQKDLTIPYPKLQDLMLGKITADQMHEYLRNLRDQSIIEATKKELNESKSSPCDKKVLNYLN